MLSGIAGLVIAITGVIAGILALLSDELKKNNRLKYILVGVLLAFSVYAMLGSLLAFSSNPNSSLDKQKLDIPIAIDSTPDWHPTGVTATEGEFIKIEVVGGKWTVLRDSFPDNVRNQIPEQAKEEISKEIFMNWYRETDGSGSSSTLCELDDNCPILGQKVGGLVALIGDTKYFIGNKCIFKATNSGQIFLQINDNPSEPTNNFGVLAVAIKFVEDSSNVISSSCGIPNP